MGPNDGGEGKDVIRCLQRSNKLAKLLIRCSRGKALSPLLQPVQHQPHSIPTPSPSPLPTPPSLRRVSPTPTTSPLQPNTDTSFSIFSIAILYQSISRVNVEKKWYPGTVHQNIYITIRAAPFTTLFAARSVFSCFRSSPEFAAEA
jgi:hypothetical protein